MPQHARFSTIDQYIAAAAPQAQPILERLRATVRSVAPDATETISYQMPAFRAKRVFVYFAAFKNHIGVYPPARGDAALDADLLPYRGEKGNLRFPLAEPMPYELFRRVVEALAQQR